MTANVFDGKSVASSTIERIKEAVADSEQRHQTKPRLSVIIVGDDPASHVYVSAKSKMAKLCGFHSAQHALPETTSQCELLDFLEKMNADRAIHDILVQLPLPRHLEADPIIQSIRPEKDVNGLHVLNAGRVATGDIDGALVSCRRAGAMVCAGIPILPRYHRRKELQTGRTPTPHPCQRGGIISEQGATIFRNEGARSFRNQGAVCLRIFTYGKRHDSLFNRWHASAATRASSGREKCQAYSEL